MGTTTGMMYLSKAKDYTIPRNKWELQLTGLSVYQPDNYTIPRNKWELQPPNQVYQKAHNYTIPRNKWELQLA